MKGIFLAFLTISLLPLHAQQPARPTPVFPQFPANLFPGAGGGFLGLRSEPPFRAMVEKKDVSATAYSITLKSATGSRTFSQMPPGGDELKMLEHLIVGHEYEFPKVFDDVLGKRKNAGSSPGTAFGMAASNSSSSSMGLEDLVKSPPFRGRVTRLKVSDDSVSMELHCTDGRRLTFLQLGSDKIAEARRIAKLLKEGEIYEFPDDIRPVGPDEKRVSAGAPIVPSSEMKALEGFVGEWEMPMYGDPDRKLIVTFLWKKDGRGLWRELRGEPPNEKRKVDDASLTTYDPVQKAYVEVWTRPISQLRQTVWNWDPNTRTLSSRAVVDQPQPGSTQSSTRTLFSADRLDWHYSTVTPEGQPLNDNGGHYIRVKAAP